MLRMDLSLIRSFDVALISCFIFLPFLANSTKYASKVRLDTVKCAAYTCIYDIYLFLCIDVGINL